MIMTAELAERSIIEGVSSLEVRWIFPGELDNAVAQWFRRFPTVTESRQDLYLLHPGLRRLSVKLRGGGALEVKACHNCPGILEVPGRARGHLESWQKWSVPFGRPGPHSGPLPRWWPVDKRRRLCRFSLAGGQLAVAGRSHAGPGCSVELTEVRAGGQAWWSLGYEATGPAGLLRHELEAAATVVFAQALPGGVELSTGDSRSIPEWLSLSTPQPGHAGALTDSY
jgi:hypothetical protein